MGILRRGNHFGPVTRFCLREKTSRDSGILGKKNSRGDCGWRRKRSPCDVWRIIYPTSSANVSSIPSLGV